MMNSLWVARDADEWLTLFYEQPQIINGSWFSPNRPTRYIAIEAGWYPSLKPGECRRLVMESEVSE
mgnify:CR=1 FL=1